MSARAMRGASLRVVLTPGEVARLRRPVLGTGGLQSLLRRLQARLRGADLDVYMRDLPRIARYVRHGKGGFQQRFPIATLRQHLPSIAPLFIDIERLATPDPWIYFKREALGGDPRIKIGQTSNPRGARVRPYTTDNPKRLDLLLLLAPQPHVTDRTYHRRFAHLRSTGEWFWPGDDLLAFIYARADTRAS